MTSARGPAQQLVKRNDLQSLCPHGGDDPGKSQHGLLAITSAIVQQDDVAAANVARGAGRQMGHDVSDDLIGAVAWIVAPVVGIDLVADGDVAHVLRGLERADLVFGVGLGVNRIGRAEQNRRMPRRLAKSCSVRLSSTARMNPLEMLLMSGWVKVWFPISCPSR